MGSPAPGTPERHGLCAVEQDGRRQAGDSLRADHAFMIDEELKARDEIVLSPLLLMLPPSNPSKSAPRPNY